MESKFEIRGADPKRLVWLRRYGVGRSSTARFAWVIVDPRTSGLSRGWWWLKHLCPRRNKLISFVGEAESEIAYNDSVRETVDFAVAFIVGARLPKETRPGRAWDQTWYVWWCVGWGDY